MIELQNVILKFISTIDPQDDPYQALSVYIKDQFLPSVPQAAIIQLYCLATVLAVLSHAFSFLFPVASSIFTLSVQAIVTAGETRAGYSYSR